MNIVIFGAGAIGSLFGALLSKNNDVTLIGRKNHVNAINKNGLKIKEITKLNVKIKAADSIGKEDTSPDLLILTVKSYDTKSAIQQANRIIGDKTTILTLQNGLDNIEKIMSKVNAKKIIAGITTHGAIFSEPGVIEHTGVGSTILGEIDCTGSECIKNIVNVFNQAKIKTNTSSDIIKEIWIKAIINSSINPLTTFFQCKNGYLLKNPILEKIVEKICKESTNIAIAEGINLSYSDMIKKTKEVIKNTSNNYSSMLQSFKKFNETEIDSINGKIIEIGRKYDTDSSLNEMLIHLIKGE